MVVITLKKSIPGLINEAGSHRVMRVPPSEKRGRVHTSTVTVSVITENHQTTKYDRREEEDFSYRWFSGTGAGGQHKNKKMCTLELTHIPTGLKQIGANNRSRIANERDAMASLLLQLDKVKNEQHSTDRNNIRSTQIGTGGRGDRRRTYRFIDDQIIDHVTGKNTSCKIFMRGDIERLW